MRIFPAFRNAGLMAALGVTLLAWCASPLPGAPQRRVPLKATDLAGIVQWISSESIGNVTPAVLLNRMVKSLKSSVRAGVPGPILEGDVRRDVPSLARWLAAALPGPAEAAHRGLLLRNALLQALTSLQEDGTKLHLPHQYMLPPEEEGYDKGGVGILVDPKHDAKKRFVIFETLDGFPGQAVGLRPGDCIVRVAGQPVNDLSYRQLADLVRGNLGTRVTITVERIGQTKPLDFTVERVWLNPNPKNISSHVLPGGLGYIRFKYLGERMDIELEKALDAFHAQNVRALVVDLRNNEGLIKGSLDVAGCFVPRSTLLTTLVTRKGKKAYFTDRSHGTDLPLVVIVNRYTSGAGILMAGALRDAGRCTLVGESTVWRDQPIDSRRLSDGSVVTVTTGYYMLPKGQVLRNRRPAVDPSVTVQQDPLAPVGGNGDAQLNRALESAKALLQ